MASTRFPRAILALKVKAFSQVRLRELVLRASPQKYLHQPGDEKRDKASEVLLAVRRISVF